MYCKHCFDNDKIYNLVFFSMILNDEKLYSCEVCGSLTNKPEQWSGDMAKKPSSKKQNQKTVAEERVVCQFCKRHTNNPSFCKQKGIHVGRKHNAKDCEFFDRA